jgi:hypothetical protein
MTQDVTPILIHLLTHFCSIFFKSLKKDNRVFTFAMACPSRLRVYQENHMINAVIEKKPMVRNDINALGPGSSLSIHKMQ